MLLDNLPSRALKRRSSDQKLVHRGTKGVKVTSRPHRLTACFFWWHVRTRRHNDVRSAQRRWCAGGEGEVEVSEVRLPVRLIEPDIPGLYVPMNDVPAVRVGERVADFGRIPQGTGERQG